ncbi:MAG: hypothetical protein HN742_34785 [Lentisphaerae bacterium]|jgi:hypothetical protein|nr:hypothetical protein [Lentisphaerota bacterium]MBT4817495.1 hypothetical protein [Lentisphaerota bacterium]MBT5612991.1 hypothetical protein [Lentisphaerota bacterium]MBT7059069.1 hypothetical protein [Lentisphaerota bacterium]MBT7847089.1 hypothetical protein [Lentisphaerota bacterium]
MNPFPFRQGTSKKSQVFTGIPTVQQWTQVTKTRSWALARASRFSAGLQPLDLPLKEYHAFAEAPIDFEEEAPAAKQRFKDLLAVKLLGICVACQDYLGSSVNKGQSKVKKHGHYCVVTLLMEATKYATELATKPKETGLLVSALQMQTFGKARARLNWKMMREDFRQLGVLGNNSGGALKALDSHYWLEANLGGSNPKNLQGASVRDKWAASGEESFFIFAKKRAQELERDLSHVKYIEKGDRWRFHIVFHKGKLYRRKEKATLERGEPLGCTGKLFIIDSQGYCMVMLPEKLEGQIFHHSSMPGGEAVLFAGAIDATNGKVTLIDNGSGHYKPKMEQCVEGMKVLQENGVDLKNVPFNFLAGMVKMGEAELPNFAIIDSAQEILDSHGDFARMLQTGKAKWALPHLNK